MRFPWRGFRGGLPAAGVVVVALGVLPALAATTRDMGPRSLALFDALSLKRTECPYGLEFLRPGRQLLCGASKATPAEIANAADRFLAARGEGQPAMTVAALDLVPTVHERDYRTSDSFIELYILEHPEGVVIAYPTPFPACDRLDRLEMEPDPSTMGDVTLPKLIKRSRKEPAYPELARRKGVSGRVILLAFVARDGSVGNACVLESDAKFYGFEIAALKAVRAWRYEPARRNGAPTAIPFVIRVDFKLQ